MELQGQNRIVVRDLLQYKIEEMFDVHPVDELLKETQWVEYNKVMDDIVAEQGFEEYPSSTYQKARYFYRGLNQQPKTDTKWSNEEMLMIYAMLVKLRQCAPDSLFDAYAADIASQLGGTEDNFFDIWNEFEIEMIAHMYKNLKWTVDDMVRFTVDEHKGLFQNVVNMFNGDTEYIEGDGDLQDPDDIEEYDHNVEQILQELKEATDRLIKAASQNGLQYQHLLTEVGRFEEYDEGGAKEILKVWQEAFRGGHFKGLKDPVARDLYDRMMGDIIAAHM